MAKNIIAAATIAAIRTELREAAPGNVIDRLVAVEHALETILRALEEAK